MLRRITQSMSLAIKVAVIGFDMAYRQNKDIDSILGYRDELTQLPNLKAFERDRKNVTKDYALVLIDIDNFKEINDKNGHPYGDNILKRLANVLKSAIASFGQAYRLHGDEYAIIVQNSEVERVCQEVQNNIRDNDSFTISQGVVYCTDVELTEKEFEMADSALYQSKNSGKGMTTVIPVAA